MFQRSVLLMAPNILNRFAISCLQSLLTSITITQIQITFRLQVWKVEADWGFFCALFQSEILTLRIENYLEIFWLRIHWPTHTRANLHEWNSKWTVIRMKMDRLKQNQTVICIKVDGPVPGVRRLTLNSTSSFVFFQQQARKRIIQNIFSIFQAHYLNDWCIIEYILTTWSYDLYLQT